MPARGALGTPTIADPRTIDGPCAPPAEKLEPDSSHPSTSSPCAASATTSATVPTPDVVAAGPSLWRCFVVGRVRAPANRLHRRRPVLPALTGERAARVFCQHTLRSVMDVPRPPGTTPTKHGSRTRRAAWPCTRRRLPLPAGRRATGARGLEHRSSSRRRERSLAIAAADAHRGIVRGEVKRAATATPRPPKNQSRRGVPISCCLSSFPFTTTCNLLASCGGAYIAGRFATLFAIRASGAGLSTLFSHAGSPSLQAAAGDCRRRFDEPFVAPRPDELFFGQLARSSNVCGSALLADRAA